MRTISSRNLRVAYVSFGRQTFDLEQASELVQASMQALRSQDVEWTMVEGLITSVDGAQAKANQLYGHIDVLLAQFTTFVDGRFITTMATTCQVPVIVWAIPEPNRAHGQRLSLNSFTGVNMAGRVLNQLGIPFRFVYGDAADVAFQTRLHRSFLFWKAWHHLHQFTVITVGEAPDGFFFSIPSAAAVKQLGIRVLQLNLDETFARALAVPDGEVEDELARVQSSVRGMERLSVENVLKFSKILMVLREDLVRVDANAVAVRCWPEFFTQFGAAACSVISALSEDGTMGACEADILGALSMDILYQLTESPAYLGDLVEMNPTDGTVTFWHCGAGAFSLARPDTGAQAGVHPNRNIGFTLEFGLKPGVVTILRIGEDAEGNVRALIGRGEVLDEPQRFRGTSGRVRLLDGRDEDLVTRVSRVIEDGFEPHYAIAYGDVFDDLTRLFKLMRIPVARF
ncbi:L-fucose/L-arabinose isomerase family protein [Alicyclobacillus mengziensis]|uniref:L-fucose isomerase C-terminal domain-containing protein n=1 Tax=Alicyclobacillus mengziensis TaxID=2931921 RepID=A0A9X7W4A5_9BACL|nr:hypothetical protein [Alicyclobacillus mengziensis]QSO49298.1 hypothetical protein JZ786_10460 [Alicyclobacillus mengziensis]